MNEPIKLIQKQGYSHYEFILTDEALSIKQYTISEHKEWTVRLEDIGHTTIIEKDTSYMKPGIFISIGLFSLLFVIGNVADHSAHLPTWGWILLSMIYVWFATIVYMSPLRNKLLLGKGSETVEFLSDKPSKSEVQDFVNEIIKRSKVVIKRKYGTEIDA